MPTSRPERYGVEVERDVPVPMRDGTVLRADVYRPDRPGSYPVLVSRLPYDKSLRPRPGDIDPLVGQGYIVVMQDTRGRFASEGEGWYPLVFEAEDGYDTVEWAARIAGSNGRVGMNGQSYLAATQYLAATTRPPSLKAAFPVSAPASPLDSWAYHRGGGFELNWNLGYAAFMARHQAVRQGVTGFEEELQGLLGERVSVFAPGISVEAQAELPLLAWGDRFQPVLPHVRDYLVHQTDGPYWWPVDFTRHFGDVVTPMIHVTSWYDIFLPGALSAFNGLRSGAGSALARRNQFLVVGPWGHLFPYTAPTRGGAGDADFGPEAEVLFHDLQLDWFDHWLGADDPGPFEASPVRLFVMGINRWRDEDEWPPRRMRPTKLYLSGDGSAGGGHLGFQPPGDESPDRYRYDPADPVPTTGGNVLLIADGVRDQRQLEGRADILVYSTDPLREDLEITGPVVVVLYAASSAVDTDFMAKLIDVHPDGYARNLVDGMIRARYRTSRVEPLPIRPGHIYRYEIDCWATSHVIRAGHRLRLHITSSNFPRFDRNLNTGEDPATGTRMVVADQAVFHDGAHPSHVVLPVIP